jgi:glutaredoxin
MLRSLELFLTGLDHEISVNVTMRDIDDQETWYQRYREYVPVLVVNDEEVCHYFFDKEELENAIAQHVKSTALDNNTVGE